MQAGVHRTNKTVLSASQGGKTWQIMIKIQNSALVQQWGKQTCAVALLGACWQMVPSLFHALEADGLSCPSLLWEPFPVPSRLSTGPTWPLLSNCSPSSLFSTGTAFFLIPTWCRWHRPLLGTDFWQRSGRWFTSYLNPLSALCRIYNKEIWAHILLRMTFKWQYHRGKRLSNYVVNARQVRNRLILSNPRKSHKWSGFFFSLVGGIIFFPLRLTLR